MSTASLDAQPREQAPLSGPGSLDFNLFDEPASWVITGQWRLKCPVDTCFDTIYNDDSFRVRPPLPCAPSTPLPAGLHTHTCMAFAPRPVAVPTL